MNATQLLQLLTALPPIIISIESVIQEPGRGADKLAAVLTAVQQLVPVEALPEFMQKQWPTVQKYVSALVSLYNVTKLFKKP